MPAGKISQKQSATVAPHDGCSATVIFATTGFADICLVTATQSQYSKYSGQVSSEPDRPWTPTSYQLTRYMSQSAHEDSTSYGCLLQPQERKRSTYYVRRANDALAEFNARFQQ
jgi:hypothetical protein